MLRRKRGGEEEVTVSALFAQGHKPEDGVGAETTGAVSPIIGRYCRRGCWVFTPILTMTLCAVANVGSASGTNNHLPTRFRRQNWSYIPNVHSLQGRMHTWWTNKLQIDKSKDNSVRGLWFHCDYNATVTQCAVYFWLHWRHAHSAIYIQASAMCCSYTL